MMPGHSIDPPTARPPRVRAIPAGLIGALALVAVVEGGIARVEDRLIPLPAATWRQAGIDAVGPALSADVICLGDSLVKVGVMPPILDSRLGLTSYNLAMLGGSTRASLAVFRRAIDAGANPRALIVDAKANLLMWNDPRSNIREWVRLGTFRDAYEIAVDERDPGFFGLFAMQRALGSCRNRHEIRKSIVEACFGPPMGMGASEAQLSIRQSQANRGGLLAPLLPDKSAPDSHPGGRLSAFEEAWCYPSSWYPRPANLQAFDRILALAASQGMTIFFVIPPIHAGVQDQLERRGLDATFVRFLRRVADRYPGLVVIDGRHAGYPHGDFTDGFHLDRAGATSFSTALGDAVAGWLREPQHNARWVELPRYRADLVATGVEDVEESRVALSLEASTRR